MKLSLIAGIITADIVESTEIRLDIREKLFTQFNDGLKQIKEQFNIEYEWYRGDALQVKTINSGLSIRIALLIKLWIKSFEKETKKSYDVRLSVGIGKIELDKKELSLSDGEAFRISGRNLDSLKSTKQSIIIDSNDSNSNSLKAESILLNAIIDNVTPIQSKVLFFKLKGFKEEEIAKKLGLAQSTINQHSNSGNWNAISKYLDYFEKLYANA
ncbi:MAG: hypothetical protein M0D53_00085 [Flavobacterium sp. JAD_PAG50586_2]|nr:MAG: hypothetical protein M0D53_00085 [Flavobacterium sp. JAD_PAG50586_2]